VIVLVSIVLCLVAGMWARADRASARAATAVGATTAIFGVVAAEGWRGTLVSNSVALWLATEAGAFFPGGLAAPILTLGLAMWAVIRVLADLARRSRAAGQAPPLPRAPFVPDLRGITGWLALVIFYAGFIQIYGVIDLTIYAFAALDPPPVFPIARGVSGLEVGSPGYLTASAAAWVVSALLWGWHVVAILRAPRWFVPATATYFAFLIVSGLALFAWEVAVLGAEVATNVQVLYGLTMSLPFLVAAFVYVFVSRRVRATFGSGAADMPAPRRTDIVPAGMALLAGSILLGLSALANVVYAFFGNAAHTALSLTFLLLVLGTGAIVIRALAERRRRHGGGLVRAAATTMLLLYAMGQIVDRHTLDWLEEVTSEISVDGRTLSVRGPVTPRLADAVETALAASPGIRVLVPTSGGGWPPVAARIGGVIVRHGLEVRVLGDCDSACTDIVLSARVREIGPNGRLGFHGSPLFLWLYANLGVDLPYVDRLRRAGASEAFIARVQATPASEMWRPTLAELLSNGVATGYVRDLPFQALVVHGRMQRATRVEFARPGGSTWVDARFDVYESVITEVFVTVPFSGPLDLRIRFEDDVCVARGVEITPLQQEVTLPDGALDCTR